jgi:spore maturation protein SpmA
LLIVLNIIWITFFLAAFCTAFIKLVFFGDQQVFGLLMEALFSQAKAAFEISLGLTGVLSLWLGIMQIGERSGFIQLLTQFLTPLFSKLMPDVPKGHPALGAIVMNISANMLGLDNAATPLGIKAMKELQSLRPIRRSQPFRCIHPDINSHLHINTGRFACRCHRAKN